MKETIFFFCWITFTVVGIPFLVLKMSEPKSQSRFTAEVRPQVAISPVNLVYTARLLGPEDQRFYCTEIVWTRPDGTQSRHQEDCSPWEEHSEDDYRRLWRLSARAVGAGEYTVCAELVKGDKRVAMDCATADVR